MKTKLLMFSFLLAAGTLNAATLGYSTFIGGTLWDEGNSIALNEAGNAFVCGEAYSTEFPTTSGAFDVSQNGDYDAFVLKLNPSGTSLVYSTFLGGSQSDKAFSVYVNDSGNAFVSGMSRDGFPTTLGAYDTVQNYGDGFITKLNSTGNALLFSTVIGGTWMDFYSYEINCLDLDGSQNVYLTGATISGDYPVTAGAFTTSNGSAVLTKLNSTGASLGYSSYFGGVGIYDEPWSVAVSTGGNAFISGYTNSSDFPVTSGVFQTSFNGGSSSIFVTKFNTSGSALDYSTYFGGAGSEEGKSIAINSDGNALITGTFHSTGFPTTAGAYDTSFSGWVDAFVTKFSSNATSLIFSTIIGGSSYDWLYNIALDNENNIFVAGGTNYDGGINYPTTSGAYATLSDDQDCIFSKLNSNGSSLLYSTCFGGSNGSDLSYSIDVNSSGKLVFTGITPATTFPVTLNAFDTSFNSTGGTNDVFVTMFEFLPSPPTFTNGNPALPGTGANNGSGGTDFTGNGGTLGSIATQGGTTAMSLLNVNGTNYISYYDLDCNGQTNVEVCFNVNSDWLTGFVGDPSTELRIGHNGSFLSGNTITSLGNGNY
ncbi:hypothetical protein IT568_11630, partial [bacterium]|nr:hypothetical protein [bacterium]